MNSTLNITTRKGTIEDLNFLANSAYQMVAESEEFPTPLQQIKDGVKKILDTPSRGFYVVAEIDQTPVASLSVACLWQDLIGGAFWWVQCVYVNPDFRRAGAYRAMYTYLKEESAGHPDVKGIRLCVGEDNLPARAAYEELGMSLLPFRMYEYRRKWH